MKYCDNCRCNTSDEYKYCPKCGKELTYASGEGEADPALKDMYDKLMAQKMTLSAMYVNQANQISGAAAESEPVSVQQPAPAETEKSAGKYSKNKPAFDDFGAVKKYNVKAKGSVLRLILLSVLSLGFFAALFLSFTFSSANEIKGYEGLVYFVNDLFGTNIKGGGDFALLYGNISGFKGMLFDASAYVLAGYAVSSALLFVFMLCTYKYSGFVKTMIMIFLGLNMVALVYLAAAYILAFKFGTVSLGLVSAAALDVALIIAVNIAYRKKKIKN